MKKSYIVFGLGQFGASVARELSAQGAQVLAIDKNEGRINAIADEVYSAMQIDILDVHALQSAIPDGPDGAVVAMSESLESSIMAILEAKKAGITQIWAKAKDAVQAQILTTVGATHIVIPERDHAVSVARSLFSGNFLDFVELSDKIAMIKLPIRPEWVGKSLIHLALRQKYGINVIAIAKGDRVRIDFSPSEPLKADSVLFVVADRNHIKELFSD